MKTKSIAQRLQSRISLRRNVIRTLEETLAEGRFLRRLHSEEFQDNRGHPEITRFNETIRVQRELVRELAADQKLDKQLLTRYVYPQHSLFFGL